MGTNAAQGGADPFRSGLRRAAVLARATGIIVSVVSDRRPR